MTPRQRVVAALHGDLPDRIPFTVYESKLPQCAVERRLRNEGLCVVERRVPVVASHRPNVTSEQHVYSERGARLVRTVYRTPAGELDTIAQPAGFTSWTHKHLFSRPEDYAPLLFMIRDERYEPNYAAFERAQAEWGDDAFCRGAVGSTPLHEIMIGLMGAETFAIEWHERRDEVLRLHDAIVDNRRRVYPLLAASPALAFNYGGNEVPEVMGRERFIEYVLPHYEEAAAALHPAGKLLGTHLDGNNRLWADVVARSSLDYIEAFTPPPDCDLSVAEARAAWPGKVLWINFPSSVHLASQDIIERALREILDQAAPGNGFLLGITEDVPEDRWQANFLTLSRVLGEWRPSDVGCVSNAPVRPSHAVR